MKRRFNYILLPLLLALNATGQSTAPDQQKPAVPNIPELGDYVELDEALKKEMYGTIDFPNAQLKDIIKAISKLTQKNFILDNKVQNRSITIVSPIPVTKQEAYYAFLSALYMNNLTVVSVGKFLKVIDAKSAIQANTRVFVGEYAPPSEEIVTILYPLKHLNAEEIQRFVVDLVPRTGRVNFFPDTNSLIMTDTGLNLRRVISVLKAIDVPGHQDQLESIKIRHASAKQIAELLDQILDARSGTSSRRSRSRRRSSSSAQKTRGGGIITKIVPDERTNSLVVLANGRGVKELKGLISKLDTPSIAGSGNIHIYYCKNAVSEDLATTLNNLVNAQKSSQRSGPGQPSVPVPQPRTSRRSSQDDDNSDGVSLGGNVRITADKATNSLVVLASASDYAALKQVLEKLDIPRKQVYIEATIMEVNASNDSRFETAVNVAAPGIAQVAGFIPNTITQSQFAGILNSPASLNGLVAGFGAGQSYTINGQEIKTVFGLIRAIEDNGQGQILHTPQILVGDNEDGEIEFTENIPVPTQDVVGSSDNPITVTKFEKEKVKIKLKITPQISEDTDLVNLKVEQAVDDFTAIANGQIQITERLANTSVTVRSGDTIAIGGLQKRDSKDVRSKFPILGDIPILGWLFKGSTSSETRTNLILFLKPKVIDEYKDIIKITGKKLEGRKKLGKSLKDPKDRHKEAVDEMIEVNQKDMAKAKPRGDGNPRENFSSDDYLDYDSDSEEIDWEEEIPSDLSEPRSAAAPEAPVGSESLENLEEL